MRVPANLVRRFHLKLNIAHVEERRYLHFLEKKEKNARIKFRFAILNVRNSYHVAVINALLDVIMMSA